MGGKDSRDFNERWADRTVLQKIGMIIVFTVGGLALAFLFGLIVMALWNWLMPEIFGLGRITYWQAWGLFLLCTILFKGMGSNSSSDSKSDRKRKRELRRYMEDEGCFGSEADHDATDKRGTPGPGESGATGETAPEGST